MTDDPLQHDAVTRRVTAALDDSTEHMDAATLSKLHRARQHALDQSQTRRPYPAWFPAGAVAASLVVVMAVWLNITPATMPLDAGQAEFIADTAALSNDDIDLLSELEFYAWLIEQDNAG